MTINIYDSFQFTKFVRFIANSFVEGFFCIPRIFAEAAHESFGIPN